MKKVSAVLLAGVLMLSSLFGCTSAQNSTTSSSKSSKASSAESSQQNQGAVASKSADTNKKVILVVSFGTSYNDTRKATIGAIEQEIQKAFPEYEVRRAFTSQTIIDKLKHRDGEEIDNVKQAMERLVKDGFSTVICQPTHVMHGEEYDQMVEEVEPYREKFASLKYGQPLLNSTQDYRDVVSAIHKEIPPLKKGEALVFMGHGTEHFANSTYGALDYMFKDNGYDNIFVGTVEGFPDLESVMRHVKAYAPKKVILMPFMVVAGDHANNDMAGDEQGSWKTAFKAEGYEVEPVIKGLGEYPSIRAIYVAHVKDAIAQEAKKE